MLDIQQHRYTIGVFHQKSNYKKQKITKKIIKKQKNTKKIKKTKNEKKNKIELKLFLVIFSILSTILLSQKTEKSVSKSCEVSKSLTSLNITFYRLKESENSRVFHSTHLISNSSKTENNFFWEDKIY